MELTIIHGFGHNCMELNQGKHGVESENHAVHGTYHVNMVVLDLYSGFCEDTQRFRRK